MAAALVLLTLAATAAVARPLFPPTGLAGGWAPASGLAGSRARGRRGGGAGRRGGAGHPHHLGLSGLAARGSVRRPPAAVPVRMSRSRAPVRGRRRVSGPERRPGRASLLPLVAPVGAPAPLPLLTAVLPVPVVGPRP